MGLIDDIKEYFKCDNLYEVLGVPQDATDASIKKAYKKTSLLCHPDRVPDDKKEDATKRFQVLCKVHCILSTKEKRAAYDETGCVDDENDLSEKDWDQYWRLIFPKLTLKDIDNFMEKYKGTKEEIEDLKKCYIQYEGDFDKISEAFIGYTIDEEEHYRGILTDLINKNEIPDYPKFTKESKAKRTNRAKRFKREAAEAEKTKKDMESLVNAVMNRAAARETQFNILIQNLEAKYCDKKIILPDVEFKKFKKEAAEAEETQKETEESLVSALMNRAASRETQFNSLMQNLEAKYCNKKKKK